MRHRAVRIGAAAFAVTALITAGALMPARSWVYRSAQRGQSNVQRPSVAISHEPTSGCLEIIDKDRKPAGFCPLQRTDVVADISGYVSRVTVTQRFANPSRSPIEAIYTFPLPEDAAVDDMTMTIGKRVVKGTIMRREDARHVYDDARARGQAAALLDQERPNIFTQAVANIMPGQDVSVTISYVHLLKYEEGLYTFTFPMVVGPRYTPAGGYQKPGERGSPSEPSVLYDDPGATSVVTDAGRITPPITPRGTRAGHDISLSVRLDAGLPLTGISSALHQIDIRRTDPNRATIRLKGGATLPNKDFVLRYSAAGSELAEGILTYAEPGRDGGYFTLILQPPSAPPQDMVSPREMVFVIDQTGSQSGWPIKKAKETMAHCLKNLRKGDTFQLLGFNTEVFPCFEAPVPATRANIETALRWLEPIEGSGGTDILRSVDYALAIPRDPARLRIVCYLTDGYVGNDMQILDYIGKRRGEARMFPIGIGNSVNRFLIEGMAREGKGQSDFVLLNEPGEEHARRFYERIASPLLLDVSVDWGGLSVEPDEVYPRYVPDVFTAAPVVLKGRYTKPGNGFVTVSGTLRGRPWSRRIAVTLPEVDKDGSAIATLWAREKIEDLQRQDWLGAQTGNPKLDLKDAIIRVALEHRLMSQYTSFVAVEQKVVNVGGTQKTVDVPVEMPDGVSYEGIFVRDQEETDKVFMLRNVSRRMWASSPSIAGGAMGGAAASSPATQSGAALLKNRRADHSPPREEFAYREAAKELLSAEGRKKLDAMTPAERTKALRAAKLSADLRAKLVPGVKGVWRVQVWLTGGSADRMQLLRRAGLTVEAELIKGKLVLGKVNVDRIDALLALGFVRRVEAPRMR